MVAVVVGVGVAVGVVVGVGVAVVVGVEVAVVVVVGVAVAVVVVVGVAVVVVMNFVECATCRSKPGTPQLCRSCLSNRDAIEKGNRALIELELSRVRAQSAADVLAASRVAYDKLQTSVKTWREHYRAVFSTLHDENNALRSTAASLSAKLAAKEAPRSLLEKFFNLPKG